MTFLKDFISYTSAPFPLLFDNLGAVCLPSFVVCFGMAARYGWGGQSRQMPCSELRESFRTLLARGIGQHAEPGCGHEEDEWHDAEESMLEVLDESGKICAYFFGFPVSVVEGHIVPKICVGTTKDILQQLVTLRSVCTTWHLGISETSMWLECDNEHEWSQYEYCLDGYPSCDSDGFSYDQYPPEW
jgi:hypothetical protein